MHGRKDIFVLLPKNPIRKKKKVGHTQVFLGVKPIQKKKKKVCLSCEKEDMKGKLMRMKGM